MESFCGSAGIEKVRQTALRNYQRCLCLGVKMTLQHPLLSWHGAVECPRAGEGHSVASGQPVIGALQRARLSADAKVSPFPHQEPALCSISWLHFACEFHKRPHGVPSVMRREHALWRHGV